MSIELQNKEISLLIEYYTNLIANFDKDMQVLREGKNSAIKRLSDLQTPAFIVPEFYTPENTYNKEWTVRKKIEFLLKQNPNGLSTRNIVDRILSEEPTSWDEKKLVSQVSVALTSKGAIGRLYARTENAKGEKIYTLINH